MSQQDNPDEIEYKYLNEFNNEKYSLITNFIFEKGVGTQGSGSTTFDLSNQLMMKDFFLQGLDIGVFGFSEFGNVSKFKTVNEQEHLYGFQFETEFDFVNYEYELSIGYLKGLTDSSSDHLFVWNMELEF